MSARHRLSGNDASDRVRRPWLNSAPDDAQPTGGRPGFRQALAHPTFRVLYAAESQSIVGDQLARVALAVLVFDLTQSIATTALTYAATFVPAIVGSIVLTGVADRFSRRRSMVATDLLRSGLFAVMAIPDLPLVLLIGILVVAVAIGPVFTASEVSRLSTDLTSDEFRAATGLRLITNQAAQVGGFAVGGGLVAWLHPGGALLVNAATFIASALLVALFLSEDSSSVERPAGDNATRSTIGRQHIVWTDRRLRALIATCWLAGFYVVPEGLAVPFGNHIGATTLQTGLLLAAIPLGGAIGALCLVRWIPPARREPSASWMAVLAGVPLAVTWFEPSWYIVFLAWSLSGALAAYQIEITTLIVQRLPELGRVGLLGIVGAGLIAAQGVGIVVFGLIAQATQVSAAVTIAGLTGMAAAVVIRRNMVKSSL